MKTKLQAIALLVILPFAAPAAPKDDLVTTFATCAGRFSALMEHQWLMGLDGADRTRARREQMIALLESVMPQGAGRRVLARRIQAKFALSRLLGRVEFGTDPRDSAWAAQRVAVQISACDSLLLG